MPSKKIDSMVIKEKIPRKVMTLELDEGDDVMDCIRQGMQQHSVREAKVDDVSGFLSAAIVNCMEGSKYKRIDIKDTEIMRASGNFKFGGDDLWGSLNIFTAGRKPISGTMVKGIAKQGFTIKMSFVP